MNNKSILIWDDDTDAADQLNASVSRSLDENDWKMKVVKKDGKFKDFYSELVDNYENFQLLILDCYETVDNSSNFVIEQVLSFLNNKLNKPFVIAVSSNESIVKKDNRFNTLPNRYNFCKKTCLKNDFDEQCEKILSEVLDLQIDRSGLTNNIHLTIEENILLNSIVDSLGGEKILKLLIYEGQKLNEFPLEVKDFTINRANQGLSGAINILIEYEFDRGLKTLSFVKISRDFNKISYEYTNFKINFKKYFPPEYIIPYNSKPIKFDNFYFIQSKIFENSISFREYYRDANSDINKNIKVILMEISLSCLREAYKKTCNQIKENIKSSIFNIFNNSRIAYLNNAFNELKVLINIENGTINRIFNTSNSKQSLSEFYTNEKPKTVMLHGDFHSNNILINKDYGIDGNDEIRIIDPANVGIGHWSRDVCMLLVDMFAFGIDAGSAEYFGISLINEWVTIGNTMVENKEIKNGNKNGGLVDAINWLTDIKNLKDIFGFEKFPIWEYQLSLCMEFLRISYKQDQLPPGKRAACLMIGVNAYKTALNSFKKIH